MNTYPESLRSMFGSVATKLVLPNVRQTLIHRDRLPHAFDDPRLSLTLVAAPAGYGKSTLVRQWLNDATHPSAWISLDRFDNDPLGYVLLLVEALRTIDTTMVESTRQLLWSSDPPTTPTLIRTLISDLSAAPGNFVLVLDDYNLIAHPEIHEAMEMLINASIDSMHLVLISRTWPALPLARLESRGELIRIGQDDLRFSDEESYELMRLSDDLDIARDDADAINERTEGWVTGLQLVGYMLRGQSPDSIHSFATEFSGNVRSVDSYLWEEVIDLQSPEVRTFLLDIAILDSFCPPLCEAITGNPNSAAILRQMERDRLFVVGLDDRGHWLRFHHLFSAALLQRLTTEASQAYINERHRRAAHWLEEHGMVLEASRHAIAGQDWERAIRLLAPVGLNRSSMDSLERLSAWLQEIPLEVLEQHPDLALRNAWALTWLGRLDEADQMFALVDRVWSPSMPTALSTQLRTLKSFRHFFTSPALCAALASEVVYQLDANQVVERGVAYCAIGFGSMYSGDLAAAEYAYDQARGGLEGDSTRWFRMTEQTGSAYVLMRRGRLDEAASLLEEAIAKADENDGLGNQIARRFLGEVRIEQLDLVTAERLLRAAMEFCERHRSPMFQPLIEESLAEIAWTRNQPDATLEALDRAIQVAERIPSQTYLRFLGARQARFWIDSGQPLFAERWVRSCGIEVHAPLDPERQYEYVTLIRWFIASDQPENARSLLVKLVDYATEQGQFGDLVEMHLLNAVAHARLEDLDKAISELSRALEFGDRGGFLRVFVHDLHLIQHLLDLRSIREAHGAYLRRIRKAAELIAPQPKNGTPGALPDLSRREIDVLRLVAEGLSNREIGSLLYISDKTVKRHLSSIYSKLEAANRVQAIERARQAGIL